jgi:type II secretory pathway pseudopilin PulG
MFKIFKKQSGVSLLETILVLSLISIIMLGGLARYSNARDNLKTIKAVQNIRDLSSNIRAAFSAKKTYYPFPPSEEEFISAGFVPKNMIDKNGRNIRNVFGGTVTLNNSSINSLNDCFSMYYTGVSKKFCIKLLTSNLGTAQIAGGDENSPKINDKVSLSVSEAINICDHLDNSGGSSGLFLKFQ